MQVEEKEVWRIKIYLNDKIFELLSQHNNPTLTEKLSNGYKLKIMVDQFYSTTPKLESVLEDSYLIIKILGPYDLKKLKGQKLKIQELINTYPNNYIEFI